MDCCWTTAPIGSVVENGEVSYGVVQPGGHDPNGVPIVRVKDLGSGTIDTKEPLRIAPSVSKIHSRTILRGGEVLVSVVGTVGLASVVPSGLAGWNVARAVAVLKPASVTARWLQLCFSVPSVQQSIQGYLNTTVQATLNLSDLKKIQIPIASNAEMNAISEVLGALDDKIAINDRILALLDELVRASYQLLPNSGQTLRNIANQVRVQVDPDAVNPCTRYVGLEHLPRRRAWANEFGYAADVSSAKSAFSGGDVLFGKLRPYFHKVISAGYSGICSTDIIVLRAKDPALAGLVLAAASSDEAIRACTASSEGTRMPRTSWKDLGAVQIRNPGGAAAMEFSESVMLHSRFAHTLIEESAVLARTRDELLPLLMSGKLRVKDAEKKVEAIV
ncbi:restriction endonuclease subunit S [Nocardia sp. R7R-8]|uniref:restriction endonuclease subunit S n=1 Tax=Nocardia sp. R7R-8 TaxID=3459304 RepID=UPI00403DDCD2